MSISWAASYIRKIERDYVTTIAVHTILSAQDDYGHKLDYHEKDIVIDEIFRFYDSLIVK